jgi:hypothetical protein
MTNPRAVVMGGNGGGHYGGGVPLNQHPIRPQLSQERFK